MQFDLTNRTTLMASLPKRAVAAEIGVGGGHFSQVILEQAKPLKLYLVDAWTQQSAKVIGSDISNTGQHVHDANRKQVYQRFKDNLEVIILHGFSVNVAAQFTDKLDWVYIDANHLRVVEDITAWWPHVKPGGWITGHDYTVAGDFITVKADVDNFVIEHNLHLIVTKGDNEFEINYPSWAFQRPDYEL